jgi:hypothetical protein
LCAGAAWLVQAACADWQAFILHPLVASFHEPGTRPRTGDDLGFESLDRPESAFAESGQASLSGVRSVSQLHDHVQR